MSVLGRLWAKILRGVAFSLPLEVGSLNTTRRSGGHYKLPEWGLGGAPAEIEFRAFQPKNLTSVGIKFSNFSRIN